ncbi:MAG: motility associated factor glycosyltransferase family protein, partial [Phycisphaerae bacterium]|nr:motility associated factor glycosyltransferase family protein [Phycisphaerae bacterium]
MNTIGLSALERNVAALAAASPDAATRIQTAPPRPDLVWIDTPDGVPSATITDLDPLGLAQVSRSLASQRRPLEEARRLTEPVKIADAAVLVVLGFGLGYHVAELARRVRKTGIIVVFEPDVSLLRSVLERLDLADWIEQTNLVILTDAADPAAMARAVQGNEHALALGTQIVEHPASRARLGEAARQFQAAFTDVVRAARTTVVTTMVQTQATLRNLTQNIDHYALGPGIEDLRDAARGRPAVVVAAGPSLQRNVDLLARPGVRDRVVIIAAQTVLKTLLARGIRPHFVTALDFHEISARFYEGLTAGDVEGITLVVEPKVNPAVTSAFPGAIRCAADAFLDLVLGNDLARPMGAIRPGATVAHLAYYLARWLGCDPVALIGQDLGFTDGQYYAAGAAIHDVWAGELNGFNTLEMLEWQRIARHRHTLRRATDTLGRPVYTDEQMATYLVQFERDFATDARAGLTTIDATEGGVAKRHTAPATLAEFLDRAAAGPALPRLPEPPGDRGGDRRARARAVGERIRSVRRDVHAVGTLSRQAEGVLIEMREHHADQQRVNRLIVKVEAVRDRVTRLQPAFELVQRMNQTGAFRRTRADRAINIEAEADPLTRQRLQIERDTA